MSASPSSSHLHRQLRDPVDEYGGDCGAPLEHPAVHGPAPALTPKLDPCPHDPAPPTQPVLQLLAGESCARGVAREQDFELAEGDDAPRLHQGVEKREVVAEQVEQVDASLRPVRVEARKHAEKARVGLGAPAVGSGVGKVAPRTR